MAQQTILDESGEYRITLHEAEQKNDALIITFAGQPGEMANSGFGTNFSLSRGYDTVYVAQRFETHFQGLDLDQFRNAIVPLMDGRRIVCYGSSLGAYAALYYGSSIDCHILAGAPMLPSWPGFDRPKYRDLARNHVPLSELPRRTVAPVILTDPYEPNDVSYMKSAIRPAFQDARIIMLPFAGHTLLNTLDQAKLLVPAAVTFFETGDFPDVTLPTEGFASWHLNFGKSLMRKREWLTAYEHGKKAFSLRRDLGAASLLMISLDGLGDYTAIRNFVSQTLTPEEQGKFFKGAKNLARIHERALKNDSTL